MTVPLMILAVCAVLVGLIFGPTGLFEHHLERTHGLEAAEHAVEHSFDWATAIIGTLAGLAGLALSYALYYKPSPVPARLATQFRPLYLASLHKFDVDEMYTWLIIWPTRFLALTAEFLDKFLIDGLVQGVSWIPRLVGRYVLGPIQNGLIQYYAAVTALSVGALLLALLFLVY
jgi:NADH-quinone oxidoreductase subunit L